MALQDKEKWDKKHIDAPIPTEPIALVQKYAKLSPGKLALDIACGMGRHSKYLVSQGFQVDALDISSTAIDSLQGLKNITAKEVDFDTYQLEENRYDLIVCTYFLDRTLFPQIQNALKDGGILIYETFLYHPDNDRVPSQRRFMLEKGELEETFSNHLELIHLSEAWTVTPSGEKMMIGSIVGKKIK